MFNNQKNSSQFIVSNIINKEVFYTPLINYIKIALKNYFLIVIEKTENNLYQMFLSEIEKPLFDSIMQYTRGNQTKAALILGINRGTLRKKLNLYYQNKKFIK
ncbi:helix-turn-helix domain-containing protein [Buchnera aphidicola]|uniref:Putative Fis-like DNA-binding protein n=1 Tax=Buchnera aphidicola (Cinara laricifoliae) TaxID=2518977 RepID=A0A451DBJ5_9GAMM|nr:helix-turn-helix domain-containing protein [Buchnera aphidicola]VFP83746.1 DNA-binding protein Fis [Buchnera aphidicola (Cinara laricifoliae)]